MLSGRVSVASKDHEMYVCAVRAAERMGLAKCHGDLRGRECVEIETELEEEVDQPGTPMASAEQTGYNHIYNNKRTKRRNMVSSQFETKTSVVVIM